MPRRETMVSTSSSDDDNGWPGGGASGDPASRSKSKAPISYIHIPIYQVSPQRYPDGNIMDPHRSALIGQRDRLRDSAAKPVIGQRSSEKNQCWIGPANLVCCRKDSKERAATRNPDCCISLVTARNGMLTTLY